MDDKAYTCFYCHSILPYEVCISGSHFCLQGSVAIEFWGNVVKMASSKTIEEEGFKEAEIIEETEEEEKKVSDEIISTEEAEVVVFPDIDSIVTMEEKLVQEKAPVTPKPNSVSKPLSWKIKFINLIKERPPLYDKRLPHYERTFPIRAKLWREVYEGLDGQIPLDAIPKRFKVLRDRYNREIKRQKIGCTHEKPWNLMKYLSFLSCKRQQIQVTMKPTCEEEKVDNDLKETPETASDDESFPDFRATFELKKRFVTLVGQRPALYDSRLPVKDRLTDIKVKLWREVYDGLNGALPLVELPRRFRTLKLRYVREKKRHVSNWALLPYLTFLDDVVNLRQNATEKKQNKIDTEVLNQNSEHSEPSPMRNEHSAESVYTPSIEEESTSQPPSKRKKFSDDSMDDDHMDTTSSKDAVKLTDVHENWDEDDFFGAYLVRLMKKIPIENKLHLHMEIMKMIQNFTKS